MSAYEKPKPGEESVSGDPVADRKKTRLICSRIVWMRQFYNKTPEGQVHLKFELALEASELLLEVMAKPRKLKKIPSNLFEGTSPATVIEMLNRVVSGK